MNLKTTFVLLVLVVAGGLLYQVSSRTQGPTASSATPANAGTVDVLKKELTPDKVRRIEVRDVVLERGGDGNWTMPGAWPTRKPEVEQLVGLLTALESRFTPVPVGDQQPAAPGLFDWLFGGKREVQAATPADLAKFGLDKPAVTAVIRAGDKEYRLSFGEEAGDANRFSRATYLRLADRDGTDWKNRGEVLRLAPGIVAQLDRAADYYQQRRLFPSERVTRGEDSTEKVDQLQASAIRTESKDDKFTLEKPKDSDWQINDPVKDRPDPEKLKTILTAVPDIWAEQFIANPKKDLAEYGLKEPTQTLAVTTPAGQTLTLLIGKEARSIERMVTKPPPPGAPFPPMTEKVKESYHYAKLKDNDQVFEIKADKLKDVFVSLKALRDARLARFKADDVRKLVVKYGDKEVELVKDKERWRIEKPIKAPAESTKVVDLLDRLERLEARDDDIHDKADAKKYGLDPVAGSITLTLEEEVKGAGDAKSKKTRTIKYDLGKDDTETKKLFVQVAGWPRVNAVEDGVVKLVDRPALAYRGRNVLDFPPSDVKEVEVQRGAEKYTLEQVKGTWKMTAPVKADADLRKADDLARALGKLTAAEYVSEAPTPEDLEKQYGLAKPEVSVTLTFNDKDKPAQTLLLGKQRGNKPEYFARLADKNEPAVFVVPKEIHDAVDRDSLAYRPLQLWQVPPGDVASLRVQREGEPEYRLVRDGDHWKIAGPFDATVNRFQVDPLLASLTTLRCDHFEAHGSKELDKFGLAKPYLRLTLQEKEKDKKEKDKKDDKDKKEDKDKTKERVLLIGKETAKGGARYAKLEDDDAIFVLGERFIMGFAGSALDLLDRSLLALDPKLVTGVKLTNGDSTTTIDRQKDAWQVEAGPVKFTADPTAVAALLAVSSNLRANRFAAYGPKADLAKYGLDKPEVTVVVTTKPANEKDKPVEHTIALGKAVDDKGGDRYARIDGGPGVAVLNSFVSTELARNYLDLVERTLLKLDPGAITGITRKMGDNELSLMKKEDGWQIAKPGEYKGDTPSLDALAAQLGRLRAERIAAYPAKDLKKFGLENPTAVITLQLGEGGKERVLKIGAEVEDKEKEPGKVADRYALLEGSEAVAVLPGRLTSQLLADPIRFRDRSLARFADADKVELVRGPRKVVFTKVDGTWKQTEPVEAEAEQSDLDEFISALARLRADELVTEKPEDLKVYGLDKPTARWRFLSGDKEVLGLVIGGREKVKGGDGNRVYAKLGTGDLVFLLSPKLTSRALAEYRSRSLWPALDAFQVDRVEYGYEKNPFTLEKSDDGWQVAGKPKLKVKMAAVNETLAALAALKAERTVVDKDADLKLFGLDPPQLTLEIVMRTGGKRVLQIGRSEGESKRSYARVVDGKRADVFIISEADGTKILRHLAAFTEKE